MLHGCTQNADDFAAGTQMNSLAETHNCIVVSPIQPKDASNGSAWLIERFIAYIWGTRKVTLEKFVRALASYRSDTAWLSAVRGRAGYFLGAGTLPVAAPRLPDGAPEIPRLVPWPWRTVSSFEGAFFFAALSAGGRFSACDWSSFLVRSFSPAWTVPTKQHANNKLATSADLVISVSFQCGPVAARISFPCFPNDAW
jgi:hypothetical protein